MIQRQIPHDRGTFPACGACGREPQHIQAFGSHSGEAFDVRRPTGERHRLECRCDLAMRTPWLSHLVVAESYWRLHFSDTPAHKRSTVRPLLRLHKETR